MPKGLKIFLFCLAAWIAIAMLLATCFKLKDDAINSKYENPKAKYIENMTPEEKRQMLGLPPEGLPRE